jgi:dihydrofolate reductase
VLNWLTIDGYIAGPGGETDWFVWDEEIEKFYQEQQSKIDTIIYGRATYDTMSKYWPTASASKEVPAIVDHMNNTPKIVFSKSLQKAEWNNTRMVKEIDKKEILQWKQQPGQNMVVYGSGTIVSQFSKLNLVDEYLLMVNPIVLGSGKPLFPEIETRIPLQLISEKNFKIGSVLFNYRPRPST